MGSSRTIGQARFTDHLQHLLTLHKMTPYALNQMMGRSKNWANELMKGRFKPSYEDLAEMSAIFRLKGLRHEAFMEAGYLAMTPDWIAERYLRLKGERKKTN